MKAPLLYRVGVLPSDPTCCTERSCLHNHSGCCGLWTEEVRGYSGSIFTRHVELEEVRQAVWKRCKSCRAAERWAHRVLERALRTYRR